MAARARIQAPHGRVMSRDEEASHVVPARGEVSVHEDGQRCFRFADILLVLPRRVPRGIEESAPRP
jgi:hypothetical protein